MTGVAGVAAAVLAGGASRRMGIDKATIEIDGRRMIDRVLDAVVAAGCDPVCVVGGDPRVVGGAAAAFVADRHPGEGPLGALLTAFHALPDAEAMLMVPCDVPFVSARVFQRLIDRWTDASIGPEDSSADSGIDSRVDVVVARTDRLEPMCAVWSRATVPRLDEAFGEGERSLHNVLRTLERLEVPVDAAALRNVNTPEDLAAIETSPTWEGGSENPGDKVGVRDDP